MAQGSEAEEEAQENAGVAEGSDKATMILRRGPTGCAQAIPVSPDSWTMARRAEFLAVLATTCNVREAARAVGLGWRSAYKLRRRDPAFARGWARAIDIGYDELETALLRDGLFGHEDEEMVLDGEGVVKARKIKRGRDRGAALRQLMAHRAMVERLRAEGMRDRADAATVEAQLLNALDEVRKRSEP